QRVALMRYLRRMRRACGLTTGRFWTVAAVARNTARLAARVAQSTNPNVAPDNYLFRSLVDNGEGKKSPPDMTSDFLLADETLAQSHCRIGEVFRRCMKFVRETCRFIEYRRPQKKRQRD